MRSLRHAPLSAWIGYAPRFYVRREARFAGGFVMWDVIFVAASIGFFLIGALFVRGCETM
jgi:hypothetical protein